MKRTLYVTNGAVVFAFDVKPDGSLDQSARVRQDCKAVMAVTVRPSISRAVYMLRRASRWMFFAPDGKFVGSIPGVRKGCYGTFPSAPATRRPSRIVFYGGWGTPSARNLIIRFRPSRKGYTGLSEVVPGDSPQNGVSAGNTL